MCIRDSSYPTTFGVININNSLCSLSMEVERNIFPMNGRSLNTGTNFLFSMAFSAISPPMITVSPALTVTCVRTVLFVERGLSVATSADESRASTDALTRSVILFSSLILGVTWRSIPTSFSVICLEFVVMFVYPPVLGPAFVIPWLLVREELFLPRLLTLPSI